MSMHQGLDLSKFKKVSSGKDSSVLKHVSGHEIKIAHKGISPKMKEHIASMPVHMAEGGEAEAMDDESPATAKDAPSDVPAEEPAAEEAPDTEEPPQPAAEDGEAEPVPVSEDPTALKSAAPAPVSYAPPTAQAMDQDDGLVSQDMARGHINPETMWSLFAKKDTLGKIGTIFGLLLSGAGSGLAHQQNAALEMMKNTINNDLQAQIKGNDNAQNWFKLSLAHELQNNQIKQMGVQNELTKSQAAETASRTGLNQKHAEGLDQDIYAKALANAKSRSNLAAMYKMYHIADALPEGPQKMAAKNLLDKVISPAISSENTKSNAQTAGLLQMKHAIRQKDAAANAPKEVQGNNPSFVDTTKIRDLANQRAFAEQQGMPPTVGLDAHQASLATQEAGKVNENRRIYSNIVDSFEKLDKSALGGQVNPQNYKVTMDHLVGQLEKSGLSHDAAVHLASSSIPGAKDWGATRDTKSKELQKQFLASESNTPNLDSVQGLKPPFPGPPRLSKQTEIKKVEKGAGSMARTVMSKLGMRDTAKAAPSGPREGQTGMSGKTPVVFKGGKWVPQ